MKRAIALVLVVVMLLSAVPMAAAVDIADTSEARADALYALGLFKGKSTNADGSPNYALADTSNRIEAIIMLIRMLGEEERVPGWTMMAGSPFYDMEDHWGIDYAAYAAAMQYTTGTDYHTFSPKQQVKAIMYVTFILRALGYSDAAGDFKYVEALAKAQEIGLITAKGKAWLEANTMTRAEMVDLSYAALSQTLNGSSQKMWEKLVAMGVFSAADARNYVESYAFDGKAGGPAPTPDDDPISFRTERVSTSTGDIIVNIVTVDTSDPRVRVEGNLVNDTVGNRKLFSDIVKETGADVVVTANFMEADVDRNHPLGHLMIDGDMKYCSNGLSSMGITADGELRFGRPSIQAWVKPLDVEKARRHWVGMSTNVDEKYMTSEYSVLYTPSFGDSFNTTVNGGYLVTVRDGVITGVEACKAGKNVSIPDDGYVLYMIEAATKLYMYEHPKVGQRVALEYFMLNEDSQGFTLDGVETIVSGGPRVVTNGEADYTVDPQFTDSRFTTMVTSRTAVARDADGKLLLISINGCTIDQMREAMVKIGCVDCFNTDGGASSAMYVRGNYVIQAGRTLAQTIHVFVDD